MNSCTVRIHQSSVKTDDYICIYFWKVIPYILSVYYPFASNKCILLLGINWRKSACYGLKLKTVALGLIQRWNKNIIFVIGILLWGTVKGKISQLQSNNEKCKDAFLVIAHSCSCTSWKINSLNYKLGTKNNVCEL